MLTSGFLRVSLRHWRYKLSTSFCRPDKRAIVNYICRNSLGECGRAGLGSM